MKLKGELGVYKLKLGLRLTVWPKSLNEVGVLVKTRVLKSKFSLKNLIIKRTIAILLQTP